MLFRPRRDSAFLGELLAELAHQLVTAAQLLAEVLDADPVIREATGKRMHDTDQLAEAALHGVLRRLSATFVTPIDRDDIYHLAATMRSWTGRIAAGAQDISAAGVGELPAAVSDLVQVIVRAADVCAESMIQLRRPSGLAEAWIELGRLSKQAGAARLRLIAALAGDGDPVELLRLTVIAEGLRRIIDAMDAVTDTLQVIAVKEG